MAPKKRRSLDDQLAQRISSVINPSTAESAISTATEIESPTAKPKPIAEPGRKQSVVFLNLKSLDN